MRRAGASIAGVRRSASVTGSSDLVVDRDLLGRPARDLGMVGGDQRDRLALVAHDVLGQHGLVGELQSVAVAPGTSSWVSTA